MGEGEDGVEAKCRSARYAEEGLDVISGAWFNGVGVASKRDFCMFYFSSGIPYFLVEEVLMCNN